MKQKQIKILLAGFIPLISGLIGLSSIGWTQEIPENLPLSSDLKESAVHSQNSSSEIELKQYVGILEEKLQEQRRLIQKLKMDVLDKEEELFKLLSEDFKGMGDVILKGQCEGKMAELQGQINSLKNQLQTSAADLKNREIFIQNLSQEKSQLYNQLDLAQSEKMEMGKKVKDWQMQLKENLLKMDEKSVQDKQLLQSQIENLNRDLGRLKDDQQIKEFQTKVLNEQIDGYKNQILNMMREKDGQKEQFKIWERKYPQSTEKSTPEISRAKEPLEKQIQTLKLTAKISELEKELWKKQKELNEKSSIADNLNQKVGQLSAEFKKLQDQNVILKQSNVQLINAIKEIK